MIVESHCGMILTEETQRTGKNLSQCHFVNHKSPNVMAEWFTLLLHVWEVPGSYLGLETFYPD
jgi:hypothetical protein